MPDAEDTLARVVRDHAGRLATALVELLGDFAAAEDVVADAVLAALERWPVEGIPDRPDAWLFTVARRRGLDVLRRQARLRDKLALLADPGPPDPAEKLGLLFTCCHPALAPQARVALTLKTVCGLTTAQLARAFLVPETTMAQRITRAKRKITAAVIPYRLPADDELGERLDGVLRVIYLLCNEGYLGTTQPHSRDLTADAEWLAASLADLMPREAEVLGLLALIRLHRARAGGRFDADGGLLLLRDQDRSRWDREAIGSAIRLLTRAGRLRRPGQYQLQAAIVACHAEAACWEDTDWPQIVLLYELLLRYAPSPVTRLHRAIALRYTEGVAAALSEVDAISGLDRYHLFHATRAELLRELGRHGEARDANLRALALTANPAEQDVLTQRLQW
ncbi:RNA polymerase sigma-70 factor (ECF subfamily) [Amycolatopsis bartoniae]|uniref:RNA polymerase subunit sigma-24 n=1 Tax=Amycolatopsis bartoniae TaxID=941986 RepID=A0A8H9IRL6_9PSEU|nr:DUF6596 domain-containing protein [Amycolatopsis bartoniae]MBB2936942.1 RNA polymerase sigma-70 factor (ECF subfamily) [Amycolatopsis bartoniae]GHF51368.1 RNA polymerase subunit sigma-24 [Amycolatopsis bartoniae]